MYEFWLLGYGSWIYVTAILRGVSALSIGIGDLGNGSGGWMYGGDEIR